MVKSFLKVNRKRSYTEIHREVTELHREKGNEISKINLLFPEEKNIHLSIISDQDLRVPKDKIFISVVLCDFSVNLCVTLEDRLVF